MAKPNNNEMWESISQGLPPTPSSKDQLPLPEILRVIRYCLDDRVEKYDLAMELLDTISSMRSDIEFLNWKAMVEYESKKYIRSAETSESILNQLSNEHTLFNAGRAAYKANWLEKSEQWLGEAVRLNPKNSSYLLDYSVTICTMGRFDEALELIERIDKNVLDETHKKIVDFNKGWHYIRKDEFKKGISYLHLGREINIWGSDARKYTKPRWDGTTQPGKTIMLVGEGGIGDEVINARFSKLIKDRGMNCVMSTVHNNQSMLSSIETLDKVFDSKRIDYEKWDYWAPCMDTPYIMGIDKEDIPSKPYLYAKHSYIDKWSSKIKTDKKLKVGIRWMGNPRYELELARTIPTELFDSLADLDIQMYSFQKDDGIKGLQVPKHAIDISGDLEIWDDTMGALENMDLLISSCTSVPHISAALGRPTWIVIPLLPYYTWTDMKKESYWYDTVSLYRQKEWKNWTHPFEEVRSDLIKLLEAK